MHKLAIVGPRHVFAVYGPRHVLAQNLAIVLGTCHTRAAPVLRIYEVCSLEGLLLIVFHDSIAHKLAVQFVAFGMGDHKVHVSSIHPFGKGVGNSLRKSTAMRCPCEHHLRALHLLMLFDGNQVGKGLQGVYGGGLHSKDGLATVLHKLLYDAFCIVKCSVLQSGKTSHSDDVAETAHHGNGFQKMLALVTIHDDTTLGLQFPGTSVHVQHHYVHSQIHGGLLGTETCTQTIVEEYHQQSLVASQVLMAKPVFLYFLCLGNGIAQVAQVFCIEECSHRVVCSLSRLLLRECGLWRMCLVLFNQWSGE